MAATNSSVTCTMPRSADQWTNVRVALYDKSPYGYRAERGVVARAYPSTFRPRPQLTPMLRSVAPTQLLPANNSQTIVLEWSVPLFEAGPSAAQMAAAAVAFQSGGRRFWAPLVRPTAKSCCAARCSRSMRRGTLRCCTAVWLSLRAGCAVTCTKSGR